MNSYEYHNNNVLTYSYTLLVVVGHTSSLHKINAGVPNGSETAPTLFLFHVYDLVLATTPSVILQTTEHFIPDRH